MTRIYVARSCTNRNVCPSLVRTRLRRPASNVRRRLFRYRVAGRRPRSMSYNTTLISKRPCQITRIIRCDMRRRLCLFAVFLVETNRQNEERSITRQHRPKYATVRTAPQRGPERRTWPTNIIIYQHKVIRRKTSFTLCEQCRRDRVGWARPGTSRSHEGLAARKLYFFVCNSINR